MSKPSFTEAVKSLIETITNRIIDHEDRITELENKMTPDGIIKQINEYNKKMKESK